MIGYIGTSDYVDDVQEAIGETLVFKKIGPFRKEEWMQHCQAASQVNMHTLIVDLQATEEEAFVKGIRQFRFTRNARILLIAPNKTPGDPTVAALVSLGVWDIFVPIQSEDEEEWIPITDDLVKQLTKNPSYAEAARWHVEVERNATQPKKAKQSRPRLFAQASPEAPPDHEQGSQDPVRVHNQLVGTVIIAVTGVEKAIGTTHTALLIANYLAKQKHKVALIEANTSQDFAAIQSAYEGFNNDGLDRRFTIDGVQYIKSNAVGQSPLPLSDQHYLILDLGDYEESEWAEEFWRAHVQIVVGAGSEWRQKEIYRFRDRNQGFGSTKWVVAVPFVEPQVIADIQKELPGHRVLSIPAHPDPFRQSQVTDATLQDLLRPVLADQGPTPKKRMWVVLGLIAVLMMTAIILIKK